MLTTSLPEKLVLWQKSASYRCDDCEPKTFVELAKTGCRSCGLSAAPTRANQIDVFKAASADLDKQLEEIRRGLEELRRNPLPSQGGALSTKQEINAQRDEWVEKNRGPDEAPELARVRYWRSHPDQITASRLAPSSAPPREPEPTVGEKTTEAIDKKARSFHLEGRFVDQPLPILRTRVRKLVPGLSDLERSTEPWSRFEKSESEAHAFVAEWS